MKDAAKVFGIISAILIGALCILDYMLHDYAGNDFPEAIFGSLLIAGGLTAAWAKRQGKL